jgi:phage shock protein C
MERIKLYRSLSDRMVGGVCGGLGTFLNIDPVFIRLLFVLLLFGSNFGFLLYLVLWIVIPEEGKAYGFKEESLGDKVKSMGTDLQQAVTQPHPQAGLIMGLGLIVIGGLLFIDRLDLTWLRWLDFNIIWPILLIVGGFVLLFRRKAE